MKKALVLTALLLAATCSLASAEGINLSWNDCGTFGANTMQFDCASNTGPAFVLIPSFVPPPNLNRFVGLQAQIDITSSTATLPEWWKHGIGFCRGSGALSVSADFTSVPTSCADMYQGQGVSGYQYDVGYSSPNRARLQVVAAIPADQAVALDPSTEYNAFRVSILRTKSTNTGNCAGCSTPMCIVLNSVQLFQPLEDNFDPEIDVPMNANFVYWQAPVAGCPLSTPTHSSTWGQVKSLYR